MNAATMGVRPTLRKHVKRLRCVPRRALGEHSEVPGQGVKMLALYCSSECGKLAMRGSRPGAGTRPVPLAHASKQSLTVNLGHTAYTMGCGPLQKCSFLKH